MGINYQELEKQEIDRLAPLWEKLREHHRVRSKHFTRRYNEVTWMKRKASLLEKAETGLLRLDIAMNQETGAIIGYCISTISGYAQGEIESIFIETEYRKTGTGDNLMMRALSWMDAMKVDRKILDVGAGNEEVLTFYQRYGFFPRTIILEQVNEKDQPGIPRDDQ
jgi:ribosomal protein S18 acetylase RimI-like enzyme